MSFLPEGVGHRISPDQGPTGVGDLGKIEKNKGASTLGRTEKFTDKIRSQIGKGSWQKSPTTQASLVGRHITQKQKGDLPGSRRADSLMPKPAAQNSRQLQSMSLSRELKSRDLKSAGGLNRGDMARSVAEPVRKALGKEVLKPKRALFGRRHEASIKIADRIGSAVLGDIAKKGEGLDLSRAEIRAGIASVIKAAYIEAGHSPKNASNKSEKIMSHIELPALKHLSSLVGGPQSGKTSVANMVSPGWGNYDKITTEDKQRSEAGGRGGVNFITGMNGSQIVVKSEGDITSMSLSTYMLSKFHVPVPRTGVVTGQEADDLNFITRSEGGTCLLMEEVTGFNLPSMSPGCQQTFLKNPKRHFNELGRLCMLDAFLMPSADRIGLSGSQNSINGDNIMFDPKTQKLFAIDNDTDLHKPRAGEVTKHLEALQKPARNETLFSRFMTSGLPLYDENGRIPEEVRMEKFGPPFYEGIAQGKMFLLKSFTTEGKVDPEKIKEFVAGYKEVFSGKDELFNTIKMNMTMRLQSLL